MAGRNAGVFSLACFALYEVYYDGGPMPAIPALGGLSVFFIPMFTVYLAKELLRHRRWPFFWAWLWAFVALGAVATINIFIEHCKPDCDWCHMKIGWDFVFMVPMVFVHTGVVDTVDTAVSCVMHNWQWCISNRHLILRLTVRLALTSTAALILMRLLYAVTKALRMH